MAKEKEGVDSLSESTSTRSQTVTHYENTLEDSSNKQAGKSENNKIVEDTKGQDSQKIAGTQSEK